MSYIYTHRYLLKVASTQQKLWKEGGGDMIYHALAKSLVWKATWKWEDHVSKHKHLERAVIVCLLPRGSVLFGSILLILDVIQPSACMNTLLLVCCLALLRWWAWTASPCRRWRLGYSPLGSRSGGLGTANSRGLQFAYFATRWATDSIEVKLFHNKICVYIYIILNSSIT
jgi:hypothetical protein